MKDFQYTLWNYYDQHGRDLPWRHTTEPYKIMVSELMLQQTQVARVITKYQEFLKRFPTVQSLAKAPLSEVLKTWSGLGYNRRAKYLHEAAKIINSELHGKFPQTVEQLTLLPGIGKNTAGAIMTYAFNQPVIFIETNIRTVFIHHFFNDRQDVDDKEIIPFIEATLDLDNPRQYYWALMDYGTHLKNQSNNIAKSRHYTKQSKFEGSLRQVRGKVLKQLSNASQTFEELQDSVADERLLQALQDLQKEQMISERDHLYYLG